MIDYEVELLLDEEPPALVVMSPLERVAVALERIATTLENQDSVYSNVDIGGRYGQR